MEVCRVCGGNFDNGELVGGVCDECRIEEDRRMARRVLLAEMMNSRTCLMELRLEGMESGK